MGGAKTMNEGKRWMRVIVFYDLPVKTAQKRQAYQVFHKYLLKTGYCMMQFSIYVRLCNSINKAETFIRNLKQNLPPEGSVRAMVVTEKQFAKMIYLVGNASHQESTEQATQLTLL